ncbi:MAG: hypothetical protein VKJ87_06805 [Synechococcus sp.]|nr:hypothetical protein [Synechococcus sp.]
MASDLLAQLEELSSRFPQRALRLRGTLPGEQGPEPFELVLFRGFGSSLTHPTQFDPDHPLLPDGSELSGAELLQAPLIPGQEQVLVGPVPAAEFLEPQRWQG